MAAITFALVACGDSKSPTEDGSATLVATWDVRTIDGNLLPYTETEDFGEGLTCSFTLASSHITFAAGGRFTQLWAGSFTCTGMGTQTFNEQEAGAWRVSGSTLYITPDPDADGTYPEQAHSYSISGRTLTVTDTDDGTVIVLERR
jgi:hypothetical protein